MRKDFGGLRAVDRMDLDLHAGTVHGLVGPNGAGKTTFFNLLAGALRPDGGSIAFLGKDVTGWRPHQASRAGLARTFQLARGLGRLTVLENVMLAAKDQVGERVWPLFVTPHKVRAQEAEVRRRAEALLEDVGLAEKRNDYAGSLSGGQKRLLEIARALMTEPKVVLLDEPMAGINPTLGRKIMDDLDALRRDRGLTFLLIEHDMETVMGRCDVVTVMAQGRKLAEGTPAEVRGNAAVLEAYLGSVPEEA